MLIYTYKLEKYVRTKIFPKILLIPDKNRYIIKGSFRRRVPFVTDIDIVNNVYPEISRENIYDEIIKLVNNIQSDPNIILAYLSCGTDERFKISTGSSKELSNIQSLLPDNEKNEFQLVLNKYHNDQQKSYFILMN
nr:transcription initiation factor TFIIB [Mimivirus sp.]